MKLTQISIRIEPDILKEIDRLIKRDKTEMGYGYNRSSIIRKALRKFTEKN